MRHQKKGKILGREKDARQALKMALLKNFFIYGRLKTTLAKAKMIKPFVEKIITFGRNSDLNSRRKLINMVSDRVLAKKIIDEISPKYSNRKGGYTRIIKLAPRKGDAAKLAVLELI
ncbi:MAG: 50S ribosomal protein L17 [Patescibacteria group bacterium]